jgi:hypothetical protein
MLDNKNELRKYFETWFVIIPKDDAKMLWDDGDRSFLILANDKTDRYADCFECWEEIENTYPDALFGLERRKRKDVDEWHLIKLIKRIDKAIENKVMKTGSMGTETVPVSLLLTDEEKKLFLHIDKYDCEKYNWSFEGNKLDIFYTEEI